jgi:hypothetical protein
LLAALMLVVQTLGVIESCQRCKQLAADLPVQPVGCCKFGGVNPGSEKIVSSTEDQLTVAERSQLDPDCASTFAERLELEVGRIAREFVVDPHGREKPWKQITTAYFGDGTVWYAEISQRAVYH